MVFNDQMSDCLQKAFQTGTNARLDERIFSMCQVKNQPLVYLMLMTHPSLYRVDNLTDEVSTCIVTWPVCPGPIGLNFVKLKENSVHALHT